MVNEHSQLLNSEVGAEGSLNPSIEGVDNDSLRRAQLLRFAKAWERAPRLQRRIAQRGVFLQFLSKPPPLRLPPPRAARSCPILGKLVQVFLDQQVIVEVPAQPCFLSSIFAVPKDSNNFRLILNLTKLNSFLKVQTFRMTSHTSIHQLLPKGAWMAKLDIQDA